MKLQKILFLFFVIISAGLTSCQVVPRDQYDGRQSGFNHPGPQYGPPQGARRRRPGPPPQAYQDGGFEGGAPEPTDEFREHRGPRRHWNARFSGRTGVAIWTLDGKPISADLVPDGAKQGFENNLRRKGYKGPINHSSGGVSTPASSVPSFSTPDGSADPIPEDSGAGPIGQVDMNII